MFSPGTIVIHRHDVFGRPFSTDDEALNYIPGLPPGAGGGFPIYHITPNGFTVGPICTGLSESRSFTVSNVGTAMLEGTASVVNTPDPGPWSGGGGFSIPPGGTAMISVTYAPSAAGAHSAQLQVTSNDPATPTDIRSLSGSAIVCTTTTPPPTTTTTAPPTTTTPLPTTTPVPTTTPTPTTTAAPTTTPPP